MEKAFTGVHSAIFSVYDKGLNVIKESVNKMVNDQLAGGISGFYVGGNTGECTVLPSKTRKQMLEAVIEANNCRGKIMAHIGAGHFDEVMDLLDHANNQKIDAIASLPPSLCSYYGHNETIEYYKALAKASKVPVYAYVTPVTMQHSELYSFASELSKIETKDLLDGKNIKVAKNNGQYFIKCDKILIGVGEINNSILKLKTYLKEDL